MLLSPKQAEYVRRADRRWNFKGGATRSGKTYLDLRWMIPLRIRERAGLDGLVAVLGVTRSTVERNVLEPMRSLYGEALVGTVSSDNTVSLFGERCYVLGAEKVSQVSKIRGSSLKYCYGDEVADWSREVFELLKSRLDKDYSCFDGTYNPQYPGHWLKHFLDSGADLFQQSYTIDDNPFLPEAFRANLKQEYAGTVFYDRYILGRWTLAEGLVYPMFRRDRHIARDYVRAGRYYVCVDYGTVNPTAMGLWRVRDGVGIMVAEYYYDSRKRKRQKTDEEYYADLERLAGERDIARVIVDPSAASFKECIRRHGRFHVWDADNAVLDGIRLTGTLLQAGRLLFDESCVNTFAEFEAYLWDGRSGEDAVLKENDHSMDQLRYFVQTVMRREIRGLACSSD